MAAPIGPGDWVECVGDGGFPGVVIVGALYLVEDVGICCAIDSLKLRGVCHPENAERRWVRASYFRPIYRPKSEIIEALKAPPKRAPVRETEPA